MSYPKNSVHLVITDSGLGGLSICAAIEAALRASHAAAGVRLTYVNAWPEQGRGYNDLPDMGARARVFDRALQRMAALGPDHILIACNTLSIVYEHTVFRRQPTVPVEGIVDRGVDLFADALSQAPGAGIVLLGTRTTIGSGVHRQRLLLRGIAPERVGAMSCHGLAAAIEQGARTAATAAMIETCAASAAEHAPHGSPLYCGLCCTHYTFVAADIQAALTRTTGRAVTPLDPNARVARDVSARILASGTAGGRAGIPVEVISKVSLNDRQRLGMAALVKGTSPATAAALRAYRHVPDFFQESA